MKAALYARYSSENQREASIDDQFRGCEQIATAAGFTIVARFEDRAISGGTADRPGYQAMLAAARAGAFERIVVEDVSRLWRNRAECGQRSAELEDLGIHVLTAVGDDTARDGSGLVFAIKSALAEHARKEIAYRTRRGMEGLARAGKSTGGRTFGYRTAEQIDPEQARVVRAAFELYAGGLTAARVADALNRDGLPAPRGGLWQASTITAMLANPRYAGSVSWGASVGRHSAADSRRTRRIRRPTEAIVRQAPELAIVPEALWQAVAATRARRACAPVGSMI